MAAYFFKGGRQRLNLKRQANGAALAAIFDSPKIIWCFFAGCAILSISDKAKALSGMGYSGRALR